MKFLKLCYKMFCQCANINIFILLIFAPHKEIYTFFFDTLLEEGIGSPSAYKKTNFVNPLEESKKLAKSQFILVLFGSPVEEGIGSPSAYKKIGNLPILFW